MQFCASFAQVPTSVESAQMLAVDVQTDELHVHAADPALPVQL
jgi:hypothetical protein